MVDVLQFVDEQIVQRGKLRHSVLLGSGGRRKWRASDSKIGSRRGA
jgi:hypothetical protein